MCFLLPSGLEAQEARLGAVSMPGSEFEGVGHVVCDCAHPPLSRREAAATILGQVLGRVLG